MFDSEEDDELEFVYAQEVDTCRRYIFEFTNHTPSGIHCANAVLFARQQLLQQVAKEGFNVLLLEGGTSDLKFFMIPDGRLPFYDKGDVIVYKSTTAVDPAAWLGSCPRFVRLLSSPC
ncbi:hypothetical protein V8B97DRAFT_2009005 [Scleroderma yunnanense]